MNFACCANVTVSKSMNAICGMICDSVPKGRLYVSPGQRPGKRSVTEFISAIPYSNSICQVTLFPQIASICANDSTWFGKCRIAEHTSGKNCRWTTSPAPHFPSTFTVPFKSAPDDQGTWSVKIESFKAGRAGIPIMSQGHMALPEVSGAHQCPAFPKPVESRLDSTGRPKAAFLVH